MRKLVFINLSIDSGYSGVNHGIAYLVTVVKKHSYNVSCLYIRHEISDKEFRKEINKLNPSIVAFSLTSQQLKFLTKYSKAIENCTDILQIAGGVGSTLDPEGILSHSLIKGACIGEGEVPLENLLRNIENEQNIFKTEGFYWKINGKIKKNLVCQFKTDLSSLDYPDYSIFERNVVVYEGRLNVMLSRGCPYSCNYCSNKAIRSVYPSSGKYFRLPSVEHSIKVIEGMINHYPETQFIEFEDDLLIANKTWFIKFSEKYLKSIDLPYRICVRAECIDQDILEALKRSGCREVYLGLESGNENFRKNILNRKYSNSLFIEKCRMIKETGLELFTFNIVGFPFEGKKEMEDTLELNKKIVPNKGICSFFYPYKGTQLYKICEENNLLRSEEEMISITNYNKKPAIKMSKAQEKECIDFQKKISYYLARQSYLTGMSRLPSGINKYSVEIYYWFRYFLQRRPLLKVFFTSLGMRALIMGLLKRKPR